MNVRSTGSLIQFLILLLVASVPALCRADSPQTSSPTSQPSPGGGKIIIEVPVFAGGEGSAFFLKCADDYNKLHPDRYVDLQPDPRIDDKVRVRILEGTYPEITNASLDWEHLIANGEVLPIQDFLNGPSYDGKSKWADTFAPGSLDTYNRNGKIYAVPFAYFVNGIWYNKVMFQQNGWTEPKTWNEFFALCDKVKKTGIAPLAFQGRYPYYAIPFIDSAYYFLAGRDRYAAQQRGEAGQFDNPECIQSLAIMQRIHDQCFQDGAMGMSHTESQLQFFLGHTAMIGCGAWLKSEMLGKIPDGFQLGFFQYPRPDHPKADASDINVFSNYYFVLAHSLHAKEAVDFLRFMTSQAEAGEFSHMQDIPAAIVGASQGNLSADLTEAAAAIANSKNSFGRPAIDPIPQLGEAWNDDLAALLRDAKDSSREAPEQAAKHLESAAATIRHRSQFPDQITVNHVLKPVLLLAILGLSALYWVVSTVRVIATRGKQKEVGAAGRTKLGAGNLILFVAPAILFYTAFVIVPCVRSFIWSFHSWDGLTDIHSMPFAGLLNFKRILFESDQFWTALDNNIFLMVMVPLFVVPLALFLSACISRGVIGATLFRIIFFFPNLLGSVAVTLLWMQMYTPSGGLVNSFLTKLGFSSFNGFAWLAGPNMYWAIIPMSVWGACGFNMVLYLAAMENVPTELYEAAVIDGASPFRQFFSITIPLIWEALTISIVFLVIGGMKAFEIIWLLTNQRPTTDLHVISTRMIQVMFQEFRVGEATAIAVVLFLMVFFGTAVSMRAMRRETIEM